MCVSDALKTTSVTAAGKIDAGTLTVGNRVMNDTNKRRVCDFLLCFSHPSMHNNNHQVMIMPGGHHCSVKSTLVWRVLCYCALNKVH